MIPADQPKIFTDLPIQAGFSSDTDGDMRSPNVGQNVLPYLQLNSQKLAHILCTYNRPRYDNIQTITHENSTSDGAPSHICDALITNVPNITLALPVADCIAAILYDPVQHATGLAHLGRHGTIDNLARKTVIKMQETYGSKPQDLRIFLSPSIKASHYAMDFWEYAKSDAWQGFYGEKNGKFFIDLPGYNTAQLVKAGVLAKNIEISTINTATSPHYGSHYAAKVNADKSEGRFLVHVALN